MEQLEHLRIPFEKIKLATNNFGGENLLGKGGFGPVYRGELSSSGSVAVKRLDGSHGQGQREFLMEIALLYSYKHENLVSLVGFCEENGEKILVYELLSRGSLDRYLSSMDLTWMQRLKICLGAAHGLNYLHSGVGTQHRILHRDIKSSNILLNGNWEAKISDFGLSKIGLSNQAVTFMFSNVCGTHGYVDPVYMNTGILTKESDVYSFGVVLFEVLCGRLACMMNYEDERRFLGPLAQLRYEQGRLDEIISRSLKEQMNPYSFNIFSAVAYKCLKGDRRERPTMGEIVKDLENALELQLGGNMIQVGSWGRPGGEDISWSFNLERNHKLKKITIEHGDWIYSLRFTTEDSNGALRRSRRYGGDGPSQAKFSEIRFDAEEKITGISGTVGVTTGTYYGITVITSLLFLTNKKSNGPFGKAKGTAFSVPWDKGGELAGFYGHAAYYLDNIGFYFAV